MQWTFKFATYNRRELNDYEYTITVEEYDSYSKAIKKAVGKKVKKESLSDWRTAGVEWHIQSVSVDDSEFECPFHFFNPF